MNYWYLLLLVSFVFICWSCDIHTASDLFVFFLLVSTGLLDRAVWGIEPFPVKCFQSFSPSTPTFSSVDLKCDSISVS